MRVVLDANVLVSALISRQGAPGKILQAWKEEQFDLVVSPLTLEELERILLYPKIREKYQLPVDQLEQFLLLVISQASVVHPKKELQPIRRPCWRSGIQLLG